MPCFVRTGATRMFENDRCRSSVVVDNVFGWEPLRCVLCSLEHSNDTAPMEVEASESFRSCWSCSGPERVRSGESGRVG